MAYLRNNSAVTSVTVDLADNLKDTAACMPTDRLCVHTPDPAKKNERFEAPRRHRRERSTTSGKENSNI